jgi:molybdopterin-guanine dinucleotide biosynthesis protein A
VDVEVDGAHRSDDIRMAYPATLLVLAGGQSRRMGRPKALLPVQGTTLVEWLVRRLEPSFQELLVAAGEPAQLPPGLRSRFVADRRPGTGPLAGIEAGLAASKLPTLVAVACDMPHVTPAAAERMAAAAIGHDAAVPRFGARPEPACAAYRRGALEAISAALDQGRRKASEVLGAIDVNWLDDLEPALFTNLNTPDEYRAFLASISKTR